MPKGKNPNSLANLVQFSGKSRDEVEQIQRKGGKNSGVTRRKFKTFREEIKKELTAERGAKMIDKLLAMAESGNINAIKLVLQIIGEDPANKIEISGQDNSPLVIHWMNSPDEIALPDRLKK